MAKSQVAVALVEKDKGGEVAGKKERKKEGEQWHHHVLDSACWHFCLFPHTTREGTRLETSFVEFSIVCCCCMLVLGRIEEKRRMVGQGVGLMLVGLHRRSR